MQAVLFNMVRFMGVNKDDQIIYICVTVSVICAWWLLNTHKLDDTMSVRHCVTPGLKEMQNIQMRCFFLVILLSLLCLWDRSASHFGHFLTVSGLFLYLVIVCLLTELCDFQTRNVNTHITQRLWPMNCLTCRDP